MSEENVEILRRAYHAYNETLELPLDLVSKEAELDATGSTPDIGVVSDATTAAEAVRSYAGTFDAHSVTLEEVIHASDEVVVTAVTDVGRMKGSDREIRNRFFHVVGFRAGLISRFATYTSRREALEAAGLSE